MLTHDLPRRWPVATLAAGVALVLLGWGLYAWLGPATGLEGAAEDPEVRSCLARAGAEPDVEGGTAAWSEPGVFRCVVVGLDDDELAAVLDEPFRPGDDGDLEDTRSRQAAVRQLAVDAARIDGEAGAVVLLGRADAARPDGWPPSLWARIGSLGVVEGLDGEIPGYADYLRRTGQTDEPFALTRFEDEVVGQGIEPLRSRLADLEADIGAVADEARDD